MIRKAEFFDWIEDYLLGQLNEGERKEFEAEMKFNEELTKEVILQKGIQSAIKEKDVLIFKEKLGDIVNQNDANENETDSFELLDDFADIQEITETIAPEDLINFYDSLPKVHVYHHEITSDENIHKFYKEQDKEKTNSEEDSFMDFELEEIEGLEDAVLEKDILNLRDTLSQVAKSVVPQFSEVEIDNYINNELTGKELEQFEIELKQNRKLQKEVELHRELKNAIQETDILNLRSQISGLMETETSWNVSSQSIEDYIDGDLEDELLAEFNAELRENTDLMAEVALRKKVNESIGEKDIFALRSEMKNARENAESKEIKSIVMDTNFNFSRIWKSSAAILIFLIGIAGVLNNQHNSLDKSYDMFYEAPDWSPERSVTPSLGYLQKGNLYYVNGKYNKAIKVYDEAFANIKNEKFVFHFYKGASLQKLGRYEEAIVEFNQVVNDGDNMFIEESRWFRSLCHVKLGNKSIAKNELTAIINRNGDYKKEAKAILRRLKYTIR
ncbi:MAG: hypothetical protein HN778_02130 [Prolixibacteraceae bacterium]|jgi:tetratricopeptide (TPR) repeat protein|nr:hypothetical protein [Prolixibacteraceae bacterium]MBT6763802.1 hypothetical protein [Prolixibacteraceae bacterium]MBT7000373.1 hypothetical protein [Prolixibacteraceae bacterium]MBT7393609.1 hypothetical protein [Prolixibacteraceae bacterium]